MSERCESRFKADETVYKCLLPKGHSSFHENGNWEWWDEAPQKTHKPPTELTSLREIKDKLDLALAMLNDRKGQDKKRDEQFAALAESQGKLLARLDAMDAGLHETAMRNHVQLLDGQKNLGERMDLAFNILGSALSKPPRKPRKKARR